LKYGWHEEREWLINGARDFTLPEAPLTPNRWPWPSLSLLLFLWSGKVIILFYYFFVFCAIKFFTSTLSQLLKIHFFIPILTIILINSHQQLCSVDFIFIKQIFNEYLDDYG